MTLIKTSLLNGIAVLVKMLTLLGINKVLAIYVGPVGYAALGQFQNAIQMITTFASGAINTGVTKYTAEYHYSEEKQQAVWRSAGTIAITGSLLSSVVIFVFSADLAGWILKNKEFAGVLRWFAATLVFFTLNTLLLAILNGKKDLVRYVAANIAGSLFAFVVTTVLSIFSGLYGALIALAIYQSISFFVTLMICCRAPWFRLAYMYGRVDKEVAKNFFKFTAMALTSAVCVPVSHILVRNHLGATLGWEAAGYWEAMWRLSAAYLMLVTTTLSVYYLPKLSELTHQSEIKDEILQGYKFILPCAAVCGLLMYVLRDFIIQVLFTADFLPMRNLFAWQLVGDTLKIGSWILAYVMLGKAMFKLFIASEVFSAISFYVLTVILTKYMGLEGVSLAHALNYAIYWFVMIFFVIGALKRMKPETLIG
ncbi:O-antigen translocase [Pseudomonas sp. URMO17WK12:I11]|uniref:O-antigen translocase n=1 Tax=Pseudomonas sp. URMO17WK12:I11 TaxID=1283291 RepID=UPI00071FDA38|nr:O-antigen translocase [Pseudomonas sp. URMO17WK12:I11]CRL51292.1 Polysaccharide biosynthesis protein [Pseudomonas sp. URMO17WK12:I11]